MRNRLILVFVGACCILSRPAFSDWQYTRWGMTPKEVIAASKGAARETTASERAGGHTADTEALLLAAYRSGKFQFQATFNFGKDTLKLASVTLRLLDPSLTADLIGNLRARYGEPTSVGGTALMKLTVWRGKADQVSLIEIGDMVDLQYRPNLTADNQGL